MFSWSFLMVTSQELKVFKRRMQRNPTVYEKLFAERLKALGVEFKNQVVIGFYCVDFVVPSRLVIFELDGACHRKDYDRRRDEFLHLFGFYVVRIENGDWNAADVMAVLWRHYERTEAEFRSALGRANAFKSRDIQEQRKRDGRRWIILEAVQRQRETVRKE